MCQYWSCSRASHSNVGHLSHLWLADELYTTCVSLPSEPNAEGGSRQSSTYSFPLLMAAGRGSLTSGPSKKLLFGGFFNEHLGLSNQFNFPFSLLVVFKWITCCLHDSTVPLRLQTLPPSGLIIPVTGCNCFLFFFFFFLVVARAIAVWLALYCFKKGKPWQLSDKSTRGTSGLEGDVSVLKF